MSLHTSSYFAGVATVVATMAVGFGGGVLLTDAFVGRSDPTPTLMERRASSLSESSSPSVASAPPALQPVPASPERAPDVQRAAAPVVEAPLQASPPSQSPHQAVTLQPAVPPVAMNERQQRSIAIAPPAPQSTPAPAQAEPASRAVGDQSHQPDQAMARANDAEVRKALAAERRKEARRKWAERRKREKQKIEEMNAIAEKVRQEEREREPVIRSFVAESQRIEAPLIEAPRIRLFGDD